MNSIKSRLRAYRTITFAALLALVLSACDTLPSNTPTPGGNAAATPTNGTAPTANKPNIVFILTDDLDYSEYSMFPQIKSLLTDQGTTFDNYFVTDSLCCPSRSSILRGQYVHNHQTLGNGGSQGGFQQFHAVGDENSTIATWLHDDGYRTALMGKYLNGYPDTVADTYIPPGWDEWDSPAKGDPYAEYNYSLNENGRLVSYGNQPQDYLVDVLDNKATDFIKSSAQSGKPFFLYTAVYVPHQPATPAPRYADAFPGVQAPRTASFNEADVSDKPQWVQNRPSLSANMTNVIDTLYRKRLQSMLATDDLVKNVVDTLQATGQLNNTYIVFSSDNGFHLGQHRLPPGKQTSYDEDIHVPLIVRGPGVAAGKTVDELASNVDLAPTFAQLASATVPDFVDGRSLVPMLQGQTPSDWRNAVLIEHYGDTKSGALTKNDPDNDNAYNAQIMAQLQATATVTATSPITTPGPTATPQAKQHKAKAKNAQATPGTGKGKNQSAQATPGTGKGKGKAKNGGAGKPMIPQYKAIRTIDYTYVEYVTGEKELYDLHKDPAELQNIASTADPNLLKQLSSQLAALANCKAAICRAADRQ